MRSVDLLATTLSSLRAVGARLLGLTLLAVTATAVVACDSSSSGGGDTTTVADKSVAAPSDVAAALLDGGVHLTWKDKSDNEVHFMVFRKMEGDADAKDPVTLADAGSTSYHDTKVTKGMTYLYKVQAMSADGTVSAFSNEVKIAVP